MNRENISQDYVEEYFTIDSMSQRSNINVFKYSHDKDMNSLINYFFDYEYALNNNNIDVLNRFFFFHEISVRFGVNESLYGHDSISLFRKSRDPNNAQRILLRNRFIVYDDSVGIVNTEFIRHKRNGRQTQVWIRVDNSWKILSAHISFIE